MTATETKAPQTKADGSPRKTPEPGVVKAEVIAVDEIPKFERKSFTRTSEVDATLAELDKALAPGKTVCIRQYSKKESASGTLYNLRKRYNADDSQSALKGHFTFAIGPMPEDMVGLFVTRNGSAKSDGKSGQPAAKS